MPSEVYAAYRVVAGPSPGTLAPTEIPEEGRVVVAQAGRLAVVCADPGLALVGSFGTAWEYSNGAWRSTASEVISDGTGPASGYFVYPLPDGSLEISTEGGLIERSAAGTWRRRQGWDRRVVLGGEVLTYEIIEPQPDP